MTAKKKPPTDLTGHKAEQLAKEHAEELAKRAEELALATAAQNEANENEVIDATQSVPVVVDEVETVTEDEDDTEVIRVADDMQQVTIGDHTYDFVAGRKYKVPRPAAAHLRSLGRLYERA